VVGGAADFEWTRVAFTTVIGDAARAEGRPNRGRELGVQMPFEFPGLGDVGLIGVGELADTEPETLWWIGEGSAGVRVRGAVSWWVSGGV